PSTSTTRLEPPYETNGSGIPVSGASPSTAARASLSSSCRSASSLTSRPMALERQLRCLIAAGGTAGHVLPALAVAEELRSRGVHVTFAGSPDRAEAQLV